VPDRTKRKTKTALFSELQDLRAEYEKTAKKLRVQTVQLHETINELRDEILERDQTKQALQLAAEHWQTTFNSFGDAIWLLDDEGIILRCNRAMEKLVGRTCDEIRGLTCCQVFHGHLVAENVCPFAHMRKTKTRELSSYSRDGRTYQVILDPILDENREIAGGVHIITDVTDLKMYETQLKYRISHEKLVSDISSRFISLKAERIDQGITQTLGKVGRFIKADCSYLFLFSEDGSRFSMTHLWKSRKTVSIRKEKLQDLDAATMPWWMEQLKKKKAVVVPDIDHLPPRANLEKGLINPRGVRALVDVPLVRAGTVYGFIGLSSIKSPREWSDDDIALLKITGQIITTALQRKEVREKLKRERDLAQQYLEVAEVIMVAIERDQTVSLINRKGSEILGWKHREIAGKNWFDTFIPAGDRERVRQAFFKLMDGALDPVRYFENTVLTKSGKEKCIAWHNTILYDQEGAIRGTLSSGVDITEQKEHEDIIELYQRLLQFTEDGVYRYTFEEGKIIYANHGLVKILDLDYSPEDIIGKHLKDLLIYTEQEGTIREQLVLKGEIQDYEYRFKTLKGEDRWVVHNSFIVLDATLNKRVVEAIVTDVTETKLAQKQLYKYQGKLRRMASKLVLAEESERRRLATTLHDSISSTLAMSKIKMGMLLDKMESEELSGELEDIRTLIEMAIHSSRSLTFELSPPVLYDLGLEPALEWLLEEIQKGHDVRCDLVSDGAPKPLAEDIRILLFQAIREVIINVIKHASAKRITVSVTEEEDEIRLTVEDDGCGFDYDSTVPQATDRGGYGIFSLRERLRHLGGTFDIESSPGSGTIVMVTAPLKNKKRRRK